MADRTESLQDEMIREYQADDLDDVLAAWASASALAHSFLGEDFQAGELHNLANIYLKNTETWVWEAKGRVVGFISLIGNEVGGLFLDPQFHGAGIGRALVDHVRGLRDELQVEVFAANAIGRAFYAKYGFVPILESVHAETGQVVMRLRLTKSPPAPGM